MNNRKIKLIAYIYIHFSLSLVEKSPMRSHLPANRESTHSVCSNSGAASTFTTHNLCFEQKYQKFSAENFQFLKLKKSMFIAWASFRNEFKIQSTMFHFFHYRKCIQLLSERRVRFVIHAYHLHKYRC